VVSDIKNGKTLDMALMGLRPPLFFKRKEEFKAQVTRWPAPKLQEALKTLIDAEIQCKSTSALPPQMICTRAHLKIGSL
jgi:DNA polymerase III subunit delta